MRVRGLFHNVVLTAVVSAVGSASAGVIDSGLTVIPTEFLQSIKRALLISPIDGEPAADVLSTGLEMMILKRAFY
jgi:hypothetical protein